MTSKTKSEAALTSRSVNHQHHQMEMINVYRPSSVKSARSKQTVKHTAKASLKSPEDMYDEIMELKKTNSSINAENSVLKAKLRRAEEENIKKNEELRRTLADKKVSSNTVVNSLKQKALKLEHLLREKEETIKKLQCDTKTTKMQEMKIQLDTYYQEITRLKNQLNLRKDIPPKTPKKPTSLKQSQINNISASKDEFQCNLLSTNKKLEEENQMLKKDLERALAVDGILKQKDFEEMSRVQLLSVISDMEDKICQLNKSSDADNQQKCDETDSGSRTLQQLKDKENEMLLEIDKLKQTLKPLREDRLYYHELANNKETKLNELQIAYQKLKADYEKEKMSNNLTSSNNIKKTSAYPKLSQCQSPSGMKNTNDSEVVKCNVFHKKLTNSVRTLESSGAKPLLTDKSLTKSSGTDTDTAKSNVSSNSKSPPVRKSKSADINIRRPKLLPNTLKSASEPDKPSKKSTLKSSTKTQKNSSNLSSSVPYKATKSTTLTVVGAKTDKNKASAVGKLKNDVRKDSETNSNRIQEFKENLAAKRIQKSWKTHLVQKRNASDEEHLQEKVKKFKENRAAGIIQKKWKNHLQHKEEVEREQAIVEMQSILQGHATRTKGLQQMKKEEAREFGEFDEREPIISSSSSSNTEKGVSGSSFHQKSDYDDDDDVVY